MSIPDIESTVLKYSGIIQEDKHHRYLSWQHCFRHFCNHTRIETRKDIDLAALHLSFYLASWGMYRGSSFLLWKDYKLNANVVRVLLNDKYSALWKWAFDLDANRERLKLILDLAAQIRRAYSDNITKVNGVGKTIRASDTLITKIMLGTIGCVPASDAYFIDGFRKTGYRYSKLNYKFLEQLIAFYKENNEKFENVRKKVSRDGIEHPPMKILDMYFWNIGRT